ncbi:hypothetical protein CTAM01_14639 [Colletotrichum tamarilloi]|uniref:Uncharacterized protein n=1 Tax=Colletotrichum tamarilloi TaxID=1209934 RepID=A0ABQ9QNM2_9PEZI|nr:uncharacterized protein CTAM01_14639 [Colletotrichum tamarilloi]KAK1479646.1 hypothetical protein CTAM01_14639 [Colletotrichum tamarilloi]
MGSTRSHRRCCSRHCSLHGSNTVSNLFLDHDISVKLCGSLPPALSLHNCLFSHRPSSEPSQPTSSLFLSWSSRWQRRRRRPLSFLHLAITGESFIAFISRRNLLGTPRLKVSGAAVRVAVGANGLQIDASKTGVFPREARPSSGGSAESHSPGRGT